VAAAGETTPLPGNKGDSSSRTGTVVAGAVSGTVFFILLVLLLVRHRNRKKATAKLVPAGRRDTLEMVSNPLFISHQNPTYDMISMGTTAPDQEAPSYQTVDSALSDSATSTTIEGQANPTYGLGLSIPQQLQQHSHSQQVVVVGRDAAMNNPVYEAATHPAVRASADTNVSANFNYADLNTSHLLYQQPSTMGLDRCETAL